MMTRSALILTLAVLATLLTSGCATSKPKTAAERAEEQATERARAEQRRRQNEAELRRRHAQSELDRLIERNRTVNR